MPEQFTRQSLIERLKALPAHVVYGQMTREDWGDDMARLVPAHMHEGFVMYFAFGPAYPGRFLSALLSNDLMGAFGAADSINLACMRDWCAFLYNSTDSRCYGSAEKFNNWKGVVNERAEEEAS